MATEDEEDAPYKGPALRPDGQITGRTPAAAPPPELDARFGAMELPRAPSLELELAERPPKKVEPRIESFRPEPPSRQRASAVKVMVAALIAGVGLLAFFLVAPRPVLARLGLEGLRGDFDVGPLSFRHRHAPLLVESAPAGASVTIAGKLVGQTPWAGDNVWPESTPIVVSLPGYSSWSGTLRGNVDQQVRVSLKPRGKVAVDVEVGELEHSEGTGP